MAIAWISEIINSSGSTYTMWSTAHPVGGHTGHSPAYNDNKKFGNDKVQIPDGASWILEECAIPFFRSGANPPRRYLQGPGGGTIYFDVALIQGGQSGDGIYCYNAATGAQVGNPIPIGVNNRNDANTTFSISIQSPNDGGVQLVYQSSHVPPGVTLGNLEQEFITAAEDLAPLMTAIVTAAAATA